MENQLSAAHRVDRLKEMEQEIWDVLVIGGGITGAGIALDAQSRGMRTALIEMQDFASGTSSRSTKLVHGGLRYLKQFEVKMVAEVGKERAVVYENGPHVTTPEWMLLPIYEGGTFGKFTASIGLAIYDFLAGVKHGERRKMLSMDETLVKEPLLKRKGLKGGGYYVEYRTDDARLTIEVIKKAVEVGATVVNYTKADELLYENGKLVGVVAGDQIGGGTYTIKARKIVNATGPWVDMLREKDNSKKGKTLRLTKGIHLVFDSDRFPLHQAIYFDTSDGRMMFAIPREGKTYVGTTDTDYEADTAHPTMTIADRDYVLRATNEMFPDLKLRVDDVESSWAGVRPLIYQEDKSPSEISRKDEIFHSDSGMFTIAGGKLTGYRKMAETVTDLLSRELVDEGKGTFRSCTTKSIPISGGDVGGSGRYPEFVRNMREQGVLLGLSEASAERLVKRYGTNVSLVFELLPKPDERINCGELPPDIYTSLLYAMKFEMAVKPVDFFIRRTGALFFDIASVHAWKSEVIRIMAAQLGYSAEQIAAYELDLERQLKEAILPTTVNEEN
ncbi:glycerol-3-phosphate dehydrogenase [Paenibacillus baekrokdamisoli]|uniref:Glycerol-3-phosphate dehydrogenase n=1 Tax=Paenibacillus baekrokdamisoli TaxID=1712516 RepID=A0A3G9J7J7_9BACL|nr:glycerol-3-phosphate dehydrogenase/oxidase [Paenibacillus baekrokdamisoli]MBB3071730.1 glycerol-3-phosphate dehydrogenase [Paenibacillus baekrokdamisoli]BBH21761.1 glycerol-3-phosphate dehydrogenase [Paenibacillus baekrokdamisoli]